MTDQTPDSLDDFPPISEALLIALRKRLPERWPDVNWTVRDIDKRAGAHALVALLVAVFQHQAQKDKPPTTEEEQDETNNVFRFPSP